MASANVRRISPREEKSLVITLRCEELGQTGVAAWKRVSSLTESLSGTRVLVPHFQTTRTILVLSEFEKRIENLYLCSGTRWNRPS